MEIFRKVQPNGDTYCSACKKLRYTLFRKTHPQKVSQYCWTSNLKRKYKLSLEEYTKLFNIQKGCCAICKIELNFRDKKTHIDHNHTTREVRGLLCHNCNTALGLFKENIVFLESTIDYLSKQVNQRRKRNNEII